LASRTLPEFTNYEVATSVWAAVGADEDLESLGYEKISGEELEVVAPDSSICNGNLCEIKSWHLCP
jgi:hypothetical protein